MNKAVIYTYISQIENELKTVLTNNRFSELIIAEIINESIIELHEVNNSSMSEKIQRKDLFVLVLILSTNQSICLRLKINIGIGTNDSLMAIVVESWLPQTTLCGLDIPLILQERML